MSEPSTRSIERAKSSPTAAVPRGANDDATVPHGIRGHASDDLQHLLRDTRRRLFAAAAASDHEVFSHLQTVPSTEVEALEQRVRGNLHDAELLHRRAVAKLTNRDMPLPFSDVEVGGGALVPQSPSFVAADSHDVRENVGLSDEDRSRHLVTSLAHRGLSRLGFRRGLPMSEPPRIDTQAGDLIVVVAQNGHPEGALDTAQRIACRVSVPCLVTLAGARTVNPGTLPRVRTSDELDELRQTHTDHAIVVTVVNSSNPAHQRNGARFLSDLAPAQVWACVDGRASFDDLRTAVDSLPGGTRADLLAVTHLWDSNKPGQVLDLDIPVALIDGAPASEQLWSLIAHDASSRLSLA